jgi:hypothetical protein
VVGAREGVEEAEVVGEQGVAEMKHGGQCMPGQACSG